MKALLIGGTGFIGSYVSRELLADGHSVTIFHRGETQSAASSHMSEILGDRKDLFSYRETFQGISPDVVIDMIPMTENDAIEVLKTFRDITGRLVAISSADVYRRYELLRGIGEEEADPRPLKETSPLRQNLFPYRSKASDPSDRYYNYDKILVETAVMANNDLPASVLRLPAVYGPGDKQRRLLPYLKRMDDGRPAIIIEHGMKDWRWTRGYVENVASAICAVAGDQNSLGRIYNVGEVQGLTELEWINSIAAEVGWKGQVIPVEPTDLPKQMRSNLAWQHHLETDTSLIRNLTGFSDSVPFDEGLRRTIDWERSNPPVDSKPGDFDYASEDQVLARLASPPGWV